MRLRNKFKLQNQNFNTYIYEGAGSAEVSFIPVRVTTVITSLFLHAEVFTSLFLGVPKYTLRISFAYTNNLCSFAVTSDYTLFK